MSMIKNKTDFIHSFVKMLNNFTNDTKKIMKQKNIKSRERTNKLSDAIYYRFKYSGSDKSLTKENILSHISYENILNDPKSHKIDRTSMFKKEKNIPVDVYKNLFHVANSFLQKKNQIDDNIIAIDGVYSNTNIKHDGFCETSMSLGVFRINSGVPYDIHFTGVGKKNNEVICLKEYISKNINYFKGKTIICDRAYFCYSFFNFLIENKIKFIIRIRNECNLITGTATNKKSKHYNDFIKIKENKDVRLIKNKSNITKILTETSSDSKQTTTINTVYILTNVEKDIDDINILNMYTSRWDIEEFFKQIKKNYKFQYFDEHFDDAYKKNIYSSLTLITIKQIMIDFYNKFHRNELTTKIISNNKNGEKISLTKYVNENSILSGIHNILLSKIFKQCVSYEIMDAFLKSYLNVSQNSNDRSFERKSKRPFTKWYVKKYHELYKLKTEKIALDIKNIDKNNDTADKIIKKYKKEKKCLTKQYKQDMINLKTCVDDVQNVPKK